MAAPTSDPDLAPPSEPQESNDAVGGGGMVDTGEDEKADAGTVEDQTID